MVYHINTNLKIIYIIVYWGGGGGGGSDNQTKLILLLTTPSCMAKYKRSYCENNDMFAYKVVA